MQIDPRAVLECTPQMRVRFIDATLILERGWITIEVDRRILGVLDAFRSPTTVEAALAYLGKRDPSGAAWMQYTSDIINLIEAGFLQDVDPTKRRITTSTPELPPPSDIQLHRTLLHDTIRTQQYLDALREVVTPDDIVVDIGTGSGILAMGAALAGAKHVYAIEASAFAAIAEGIIAHNGLADRITVIRDWSTRVTLPERATVLVSELINNDIFGESILEVTQDASNRLLTPDARLIPNRIRAYALPVYSETDIMPRHRFMPDQIAAWKTHYHIDFSPLLDLQARLGDSYVYPSLTEGRWRALSDPIPLGDIDLTAIHNLSYSAENTGAIHTTGVIQGTLLQWEADLSPNIVLTTDIASPTRSQSWNPPVYFTEPPISVQAGDRVQVALKHAHQTLLPTWATIKRV
jgi:hypothetical protein